ncbi:MAG: hypothetical protein GC160_00245 [Acidobacteria bacterium]|nr:hypothetical protein [Acidobacteriota bacterium]
MENRSDNRRFRRTRDHGPQTLQLSYQEVDGTPHECEAKLWDFSEGGLGMDSPRAFQPGDVIQIKGSLRGPAYSMALDARVRVAYCRRMHKDSHRVGVAFLDVSYRRIEEQP